MSDLLPDTNLPPCDVPDEFIALVRDALTHVYDYAHLERHPLTRCVAGQPLGSARALRNLLLDTIEEIQPDGPVSRNDRLWRPYGILVRRYVDGFEIDDILADLHISLRQFQRDHRKGLEAVSSILYRRWGEQGAGAAGRGSEAEDTPVGADPRGHASVGVEDDLRTEVASLGLEIQRLDLGALVRALLEPARVLARGRGVTIETSSPAEPVIMWADATLARQAILGLLSALIATGPEHLLLTGRSEGDRAILEARVQGAGERVTGNELQIIASDDDLCDNPQPATRNPQPAARESQLAQRFAAIQELAGVQGGKLLALREGGAIVGVELSFHRAEGALVLAVDDNARLLQLFERYLTSEGYRFRGVSSAAEAREAVAVETPDAILLDVMMRDVDGWQFLQTLRADPRLDDVAVIVCSVLDEGELARALGAQGYLKKPVSQEQVLATLRSVLETNSSAAPHRAAH